MRKSARKVQEALDAHGLQLHVIELPDSTRTSQDAAAAVGCQVGQIAKSLVFKRQSNDQPLLIIASGANRVDLDLIAQLTGDPIGKADADYVRQRTGFVIGGVPPVGHIKAVETLIDQDLLEYGEIWAAAGTPQAVFRLTPAELLEITGGKVVKIY